MNKIIHVDYTLYTSTYNIRKQIPKLLERLDVMSFDCETRSVYNKEERTEAKEYLKHVTPSDSLYKHARVVAESSGLSYPSIVKTTHFIFGETSSKSHVIICRDEATEMFLWNLVANYKGKLLVWNALFDLKICYQRTGKLPVNYVDGMLMAKCLVNHVDIWKAAVGLKEVVGEYYDPRWSMYNDYEPGDLKNKQFLNYCGTDGAATILAHELVTKEFEKYE